MCLKHIWIFWGLDVTGEGREKIWTPSLRCAIPHGVKVCISGKGLQLVN